MQTNISYKVRFHRQGKSLFLSLFKRQKLELFSVFYLLDSFSANPVGIFIGFAKLCVDFTNCVVRLSEEFLVNIAFIFVTEREDSVHSRSPHHWFLVEDILVNDLSCQARIN